MTSEEQYLDELLNNAINGPKERSMEEVMREMMGGEADPEPAVEETVSEPASFDVPVEPEIPNVEEEVMPVVEPEANISDMLDVLDSPEILETPSEEEQPEISQDDLAQMLENLDIEGLSSNTEEAPAEEEIPVMDEIPVEEEIPIMDEIPVEEEIPVMDEIPVEEEIPIMDEIPVEEEIPVMDEIPVEEEIPVMDEIPVEEEIPVMDEIPVEEEIPVSDEIPIEEEAPADLNGILFSEDDYSGTIETAEVEESSENPEEVPFESDMSEDELAMLMAGLELSASEEKGVDESAVDAGAAEEPVIDETTFGEEGGEEDSESEAPKPMNAVEMLDSIGDSDEDLLALLEGIDETATEASDSSDEEIAALLSDNGSEEPSDDEGGKGKKKNKKKKEKKEKKGFSLPFLKKKKDEAVSDENAENAEPSEDNEFEQMDQILDSVESPENADELEGLRDVSVERNKKPGFFARIFAFLTEEFDEEEEQAPAEKSNEEILAEVDAESAELEALEDKGKKGKKKKDKKSKKGKKGEEAAEGDSEGADGEGGEGGEGKKKKKKEKKEKPPKEKKPSEPEKRVLSKKATTGLVAFVFTLIAAVVIMSTLLPEYQDLQKGRAAYYEHDYQASYSYFYGKNLKESDKILFNRVKNILSMQRRLDSYNTRLSMGQEVEALDSLVEGIIVHNNLLPAVDDSAKPEFEAIYQEIVDILKSKYSLSVDDAITIYELEKEQYTKILYQIIYDGIWYMPGTEPVVISEEVTSEDEVEGQPDEQQEESVEQQEEPANQPEQPVQPLEDALPGEEEIN